MTNNNQHINYTFADIERYLQDMMGFSERHQLEKAALKDPFLADAIEGYETVYLATAKEHLSAITNHFTVSKKEDKTYTRTDIENYLQGNMTAAEMHAIEKAALKDPFLADAMEGYEEMDFIGNTKNNLRVVTDDIVVNELKQQSPNYGLNDIEQYIGGKMPSVERHLMERAALKEPFLSDAIEGYEQTNLTVAKQHLINIETAILGEEKEETKVVAMNTASSKNNWLRIAAAIILMVGVGSTVWLVNNKEVDKKTLAYTNEEKVKQVPSAATLPLNVDSQKSKQTASTDNTNIKETPFKALAKTNTGEVATISSSENVDDDAVAAPTSIPSATTATGNTGLSKEQTWSKVAESKDRRENSRPDLKTGTQKSLADSLAVASNASTNSKKETAHYNLQNKSAEQNKQPDRNGGYDFATRQASNELRGSVVNTNGEPVPFARVNLNRDARSFGTINSDANGNFRYRALDTIMNAEVAANGYAIQNATINANTANTIVLQRSNEQSLAETVVTENIGRKKEQKTTQAILGTPVGGLKSFQEYVSKKKETLKKDSTNEEEEYVESLVELEFDVDRLGKPYNISVTNSNTVDASLSNKAIKIVKEGPAWVADKKKRKAKVTIKL